MFKRTLIALVAIAAAGSKPKAKTSVVQTVPASRQAIVVDVEATGVVTPIGAVDVRSKTSGQIVAMKVQTGTAVKSGDLLIQRHEPPVTGAPRRSTRLRQTHQGRQPEHLGLLGHHLDQGRRKMQRLGGQ